MPLIALCYGTRPQVIKASVLRRSLATLGQVVAIDTGQHYDYALNALLYDQLGVAPPDLYLDVGSAGHAEQTAAILIRAEAALQARQAAVVVVIGDTNSTLGVALAAAKLRVPVVHVEAGLRARDLMMAEELNRRLVDALATLLCTPSTAATRRMEREHPDQRVVETGDVAYDVMKGQLDHLPAPAAIVPGLTDGFVFATLHRAELTDDPARLRSAMAGLAGLGRPVVLAVHPRTRAALDRIGFQDAEAGAVRLVPAVGYLESLALVRGSTAVVTDSGGLQREAYWLGTPCLTLRPETEWEETIALGANTLVEPAEATSALPVSLEHQLARWRGPDRWNRLAYGDGTAADRVARAVAAILTT